MESQCADPHVDAYRDQPGARGRSAGEQLSLFEHSRQEERKKQEKLETTLDAIREKFGKDAVSICGVLQNDIGAD